MGSRGHGEVAVTSLLPALTPWFTEVKMSTSASALEIPTARHCAGPPAYLMLTTALWRGWGGVLLFNEFTKEETEAQGG